MNTTFPMIACLLLLGAQATYAEDQAPRSVEALFADFDPQKVPLDTKIVREWEKDGIVYQYVTFHIGTFKDKPARMAGFFGFPKGEKKLPGLLHFHGGGQRAFLHEVEFYAKRGYACLSINWGGREMEGAKPDDPNTDWGAVDPTQKNVPGYFNLKPGEKYLDSIESPRNNNWYLLSAGNPHHWEFSTRKINDPKWRGRDGYQLVFDVQADKPNELVVVLTENFFRSYRGRSQVYVAVVKLNGGTQTQTLMLEPQDFTTSDGNALAAWKNLDLLNFRAYHDKGGKLLGSKRWAGPQPWLKKLRWEPKEP